MRNLVSCLIIFCLAAVSFAASPEGTTAARKDKCPVCGMFVSMFADWNARVEFKDGTYAIFDGSKCMFKYYMDIGKYNPSKSKSEVKAIFVKDYSSTTNINARQALYVIWSDVYGPMGHEPIPFEKEADAKEFLKEHRGKEILRFNDITEKLIISLDNPE